MVQIYALFIRLSTKSFLLFNRVNKIILFLFSAVKGVCSAYIFFCVTNGKKFIFANGFDASKSKDAMKAFV